MVAFGEYEVDGTASAMKARDYKDATDLVAHTLTGEGHDASEDGTGRGVPLVPVAFDCKGTEVQFSADGSHPTLRSMGHNHSHQNAGGHAAVAQGWTVRRLSPVECERLQGFPDGWTDAPYRRRNFTPDGPRYKALGNSMAVPCMEYIGRRIDLEEQYIRGAAQ
jgi:DNA (cytosine-5)-methyltransferase 1